MKYKDHIRRTAMLLVLLFVGWATGCPVFAKGVVRSDSSGSAERTTYTTYTAYFINEPGWESVYTWIWDSGTSDYKNYTGGWWPGALCTETTIDGQTYWTYTFTTTDDIIIPMIIFSAGADGPQTNDLEFVNNGVYNIDGFTNVIIDSNEVKAPVFSQTSCEFYKTFELTLIDINDPEVSIYYTLDGSDPTADNGTLYTGPITIPAGEDVTVKAVCVGEAGTSNVSSATYHYVAKQLLTVKIPNKNGVGYVYYSSDNGYGDLYGDDSTYITEGDDVYVDVNLNSGYKCKEITLNGVPDYSSEYTSFNFTMPNAEVEMVIDVEFDPSSPSDPEPGDTSKKYNLYLTSNPVGASSVGGGGSYAAGTEIYLYSYGQSGYIFTGWTKDGETVSTDESFYYTMPASDAVLTANYVYNPSSPSDPQQPTLAHPLTVIASPAGAGSFSISSSEVVYGQEYYVYAYPENGYRFKGWIVNGVAQESTSTQLRGIMTEAGANVVGLFVFDPSSPSNPGANYYNPTTGQVIIDDFAQGYLYSALRDIVGYDNFGNVSSIIVKGRMSSDDYGTLSYLTNAVTIDLSRTGGVTSVPGYAFQELAAANILLPSTITSVGNNVFRNCSNLTSLTVYAQVPPTCNASTFSGFNKDNCTVFVPQEAIELYAAADYWKDFNILPITDDAHVLQVNLPADASDGRYKNNSIELVNLNSGVRQKYVISDRLLYTFNGLRKDEQYNIYMLSQAGLELGRIENVTVPDADFEVTFDKLKSIYTVNAVVLTPDGKDVTSDVTVEWLKPLADGSTTYLRKAISLGEVPDGQALLCRVTLDNQLGAVYAMPEDTEYTVSNEKNTCTVNLLPFRSIVISGSVVDGDGVPLSTASVSANQTLNGKFSKSYTAKTDRQGKWVLSVLDAPETRLTFADAECVNVNETIGAFQPEISSLDLGKTTLKSIVGARINYGFTYHAAGAEEVQEYYSDYKNVLVSVFNVTQNRAHNDVSLQYPILAVLDENINTGDELRLTATSKTGAFNPIVETVTVGENQRADVIFDIIGKGGISASFEMTENPAVIAMLYSSKGELLKKQTYSEAQATFTELEDGDYTLISMGQSDLMNSILRLSNFDEIGLTEGKDYVKNAIKVESGKLTEIRNPEIPAFDESLFYYTNSSTSFSSNKSSITTGNYLTLRSAIDFKGGYKNNISNVALVVDLPEACDFVEQSVIQGPNLLPYTFDNNRLIVQLGNSYTAQTRFCVIPTSGGSFNAAASVVFDYNGKTLTQPIGSVSSEIKDIEISVPSVVAVSKFKVSGNALGNSKVEIYEDGVLLGSGKANAAGSWNVECSLNNPYNLSKHSLHAQILTPSGNVLNSETKVLTYDMNAIQVSKVTMYHYNPEMHITYESVFDFLNPKTTPTQWIVYYPKKKFTYTIEFTNNDPEHISNVVLYVHTADGKFVPLHATFDENKEMWFAEIDMGTSSNGYYPVNCSVDFDYVSDVLIDSNQMMEYMSTLSQVQTEMMEISADDIDAYEFLIEQLSKETIDYDLIENYINEQLALLGDDTDDVPTLDELDNLVSTLSASPWVNNLDAFINQDLTDFESSENIVFKHCDGLSEDLLLEEGYKIYNLTDGGKIYLKATESIYSVVSFEDDLCIECPFNSDALKAKPFQSIKDNVAQAIAYLDDGIIKLENKFDALLDAFAQSISDNPLFDIFNVGLEESSELLVNERKSLKVKAFKWAKSTLRSYNISDERYINILKEAQNASRKLASAQNIKNFIKGPFSKTLGILTVISDFRDGIATLREILDLYQMIPEECPDDETAWYLACFTNDALCQGEINYYKGKIAYDILLMTDLVASVGLLPETAGGTLPSLLAGLAGVGINMLIDRAHSELNKIAVNANRNQILALKCHKDKKCGEEGMPPCRDPKPNGGNSGGSHQSGSPNDGVQIDPSGYVYEAVPENRVEGVQATIYYKETKEDMYGDPYEEVVLWNAEEYAQQNPLFTDENGMYRWDVPQGLWQVKFEKDGYVTACSEWLPVPPPQLDVNIAIVQNKQPEVTEARAYEEGVEVQFDKFMDLSTLTTDNIYVTANGEKLNGSIRLIDSAVADEYADEEDDNATRYASRVRFVPEENLSTTTGEIRVIVSRNVLSYAGIPMTENYSQVLDVEKEVQVITADDVKVLYGGEKEVTIFALPYEAAVGRTLKIANSSDLITSVDKTEATIDEEGKATVIVKGDLPGRAQLTFSIDDVTATGECTVDVVTEIINAEAPKSSRASGTAVYRGAKVELTTESKDGVIYFTTDGTCPCDPNGTRRKYTVPIIINDDTRILAITSVGTGDDDVSETVEFNYTLKRSDMDFAMSEGWTWISHNFETPISPATIAADENVQRIMSQTQEVIRDPQLGMVGMLQELNASESYKVETSSATARQRLSEIAWNPATPIALNSGWNWLGYPVGQIMSVDEAFAPTAAENLDLIVGQNGFAQFDGENWVGTLGILSPGLGYMYHSQSPKNVVYNTSIVSNASARYATGISQNSPLVLDIHKYASIMPVVASIKDVEGMNVDNEDYQVNAFCGSECRGIGRIVNGLVMMNVYGNPKDNITFQVTDKDGEVQFVNNSSLSFNEQIVGNLNDPYSILIKSLSGISDVTYDGNIKVSFVGDMLVIKGIAADDIDLVEVYDMDGQKLIHETKVSESGIRVSHLETGVYVVIVNGNGEYTYHKIALR